MCYAPHGMSDDGALKRKTRQAATLPNSMRIAVPVDWKLAKFELFVLGGPDRGAHLPLHGPSITVGYGPQNDVRLRDESVSDEHLSLEETPGGIVLKDLGSTNGTRVNDVPVVEAFLKPGSDVMLGDTVVRFQPRREE